MGQLIRRSGPGLYHFHKQLSTLKQNKNPVTPMENGLKAIF